MKKTHQHLLIVLTVLIFISSCTSEKRLYMPGLYTQWHIKKHNAEIPITVKLNKEKLLNDEKEDKSVGLDFNQKLNNNVSTVLASNDNDPVIVARIPTNIKLDEVKSSSIKNTTNKIKQEKSKSSNISQSRKNNKSKSSESEGSGGSTKGLGFVFLLSGLVVLLFVSILLGLLLMVPGILFLATGKKRNKSQESNNNSKENSDFVDVLYLKDGSVLRGMIVEQTPGVSIKIQTKDGNVFVYKMDEVDKMTKEVSK